jgi:PAS domain S-box-containing protein
MSGPRSRSFDAESLLHSLMENVPGAIYRAANDDIWKVQRVSDEIEAITGHPASDFVDASKRTIVTVTHPDDQAPVDREIAAAIAEDRPFVLEYRIVHADGSIRWVLERGVKTVDRDGVEWLDGIIFDITDRQAAQQLRVEREMEALRVAELEASRARILLAAARAELDAGLAELRELARGIHPALLTMRGLSLAVQALVNRSTVPVELDDALDRRLDPDVETALYYTVSEALTNVSRYARATQAAVRLRLDGDTVEVDIEDDGVGGADRQRGSGLHGLADRLGTVGGVLEVVSPPGEGTRLRARVPLR